jgi:uncharacterized protein YdeI (YjbR/CyaY-like superfamily)
LYFSNKIKLKKPFLYKYFDKKRVRKERLIIPKDLETEFTYKPQAKDFFLSLSKSVKKIILTWLVLAKTTETRQKRIAEIIESAKRNLKPKHLQ